MKKSCLHLTSVSKSFERNNNTTNILNHTTFTFEQGETYAITGASGAGKSTLLHIIAGLDTPTQGSVFFNDSNLNFLSHKEYCSFLNKEVGFVFQSSHLITELSVLENIMLPGLINNGDKTELKKKASFLLEAVDLLHTAYSNPGELSGGQQQRVALARALINKPAFLIADEPTGNLDAQTAKAMIDLIMNCYKKWHMGIIISSHDLLIAQSMNTVIELKDGTITQQHKENALCYQQKKLLEKQ